MGLLLAAFFGSTAALAQPDWLTELGQQSLNPTNNLDFLPVEQAYPFSYQRSNNQLTFNWDVQPGYYLYRRSFRFPGSESLVADSQLAPGNIVDDIEYGVTEVYETPTELTVSLANSEATELTIEFQGCAKAGLCYPPTQQTVFLDAPASRSKPSPVIVSDMAAAQARISSGLPTMLQLTASWSAASKLMASKLFPQPAVRDALTPLLWLQADVSDRDVAETLLPQFDANGPDTFIFYDATGEEQQRLQGRLTREQLLEAIELIKPAESRLL